MIKKIDKKIITNNGLNTEKIVLTIADNLNAKVGEKLLWKTAGKCELEWYNDPGQ